MRWLEPLWKVLQRNLDEHGMWVDMSNVFAWASDRQISTTVVIAMLSEIERQGLVFLTRDRSQIAVLMLKHEFRCPHCHRHVYSSWTEHLDDCLRYTAKMMKYEHELLVSDL